LAEAEVRRPPTKSGFRRWWRKTAARLHALFMPARLLYPSSKRLEILSLFIKTLQSYTKLLGKKLTP
jgi:hypothetical protein